LKRAKGATYANPVDDRLIDYLDVLAWPVVVLAMAGGALLLFRAQVGALIGRISTIQTPVATLSASPEQPPPPELPGQVPEEPPTDPSTAPDPAVVQQLSNYVYWWYYEKAYRLTFGTQTRLLAHVNSFPGGAAPGELIPFYNEHLQAARVYNPSYRRDFDSYVNWLVGSGLLTIAPDGRYEITDLGRGFLTWMVAEGVTHKIGQ
jgi:hypothetical protein